MHKRGFHRTTLALKRAKKTRYDLIEKDRHQHIEFGVRPLGFEFKVESPPHALRKVSLPACFPLARLGQIAAISGHVEAELALR